VRAEKQNGNGVAHADLTLEFSKPKMTNL